MRDDRGSMDFIGLLYKQINWASQSGRLARGVLLGMVHFHAFGFFQLDSFQFSMTLSLSRLHTNHVSIQGN